MEGDYFSRLECEDRLILANLELVVDLLNLKANDSKNVLEIFHRLRLGTEIPLDGSLYFTVDKVGPCAAC